MTFERLQWLHRITLSITILVDWVEDIKFNFISFILLGSLLPLIQDTGVIEQCQKTMPHLSHEAQSYLKNLTDLATL